MSLPFALCPSLSSSQSRIGIILLSKIFVVEQRYLIAFVSNFTFYFFLFVYKNVIAVIRQLSL